MYTLGIYTDEQVYNKYIGLKNNHYVKKLETLVENHESISNRPTIIMLSTKGFHK